MRLKDIIDSCALREPIDEFDALRYADWEKTLQSDGKWVVWALADQLMKLGFPENKEIVFNEKGGVGVAEVYRTESGSLHFKILEEYGPDGHQKTQLGYLEDIEKETAQIQTQHYGQG